MYVLYSTLDSIGLGWFKQEKQVPTIKVLLKKKKMELNNKNNNL